MRLRVQALLPAFVPQPLHIVRMKDTLTKVPRSNVVKGKTGVFEQQLIGIQRTPIRRQDEDELGDGFDNLPELPFVLPDLLFRHLCCGHVHHRPDKLDDFSRFISYGASHNSDIFDRTNRHHQTDRSKSKSSLSYGDATIITLLEESDVFRMNPLACRT